MKPNKLGVKELLGNRLRAWRKSVPLKSFELADMIGLSKASLSEIETNKSLPSASTIAKLFQFTNINIYWLLKGEGFMTRSELSQEENSFFKNLNKNPDLKEMMDQLIRVYYHGDKGKLEHLKGFLAGADPENKG